MRTICIRFHYAHSGIKFLDKSKAPSFKFICPPATERVEPGGAEEKPGGGKEAAITGEMAIMAISKHLKGRSMPPVSD